MLIPYKKSFIYFLWFIYAIASIISNFNELKNVEYKDSDDCMRILRVKELVRTGEWYNSVLLRENAPFGLEMHWTRIHDIIIIVGALPFLIFYNIEKSIEFSGALIGLVFLLFITLLLYDIGKIFSEKSAIICGISIYWTYIFKQYVTILRPDQHCLILFLFIFIIRDMLYLIGEKNNNSAIRLGVLFGLSIWAAPELLIPIFLSISFIFCQLMLSKNSVLLNKVTIISLLQTVIVFSLIFGIERKIGDFEIEYDKVSIIHLILSLMQLIYFLSMKYLFKFNWNRCVMWIAASTLGIFFLSVLLFLFPKIFLISLAINDNVVVSNFLSNVAEMQAIFSILPLTICFCIGLICGFWYFVKCKINRYSLFLIYFFVVYSIVGSMAIRFFPYWELLMIVIFANLLIFLTRKLKKGYIAGLRPVLIFSPKILTILIVIFHDFAFEDNKNLPNHHFTKSIVTNLNIYNFLNIRFSSKQTILCPINFSPRILFYTSHQVVTGPYHRNISGLTDLEIIYSSDALPIEIFKIIKKRNITIIFANNKFRKEIAEVLQEITVPEYFKGYRLYQVDFKKMMIKMNKLVEISRN